MANKIVTTNLRIPELEWLQIKAMAAEEGVSANEYVNNILKTFSNKKQTEIKQSSTPHEKMSIWDLPKIMKKGNDKPMGASEDDKIIYDH